MYITMYILLYMVKTRAFLCVLKKLIFYLKSRIINLQTKMCLNLWGVIQGVFLIESKILLNLTYLPLTEIDNL